MASEKKVILVFTSCSDVARASAQSPALSKLLQKGALFTNIVSKGDLKTLAATGADSGETLWDAANAQNFIVTNLDGNFDMCVLDAGSTVPEVEVTLAPALEKSGRNTLIVLVSPAAVVFYGPGIAKGKVVEKQICACCVAPTVAYVANFPVPAQCEAPIAYQALKDINFKLQEIKKFQDSIQNMEAAMERKSRQPWDKHDCA